jgi:hypothetical protein
MVEETFPHHGLCDCPFINLKLYRPPIQLKFWSFSSCI